MRTYVYQITNTINGKVYFGKATEVPARWYQHCWDAKHGKDFPIHRAIRKYGKAVFRATILAEHPTNYEACQHEIALIASIPPGRGYNATKGGDGGHTLTPQKIESQYAIKTSDHGKFRELFDQGWTVDAIAKYFGASYASTGRCAKRLGLSFRARNNKTGKKRLLSDIPETDFRRLFQEGYTIEHMGEHLGLSRNSVQRLATTFGLSFRERDKAATEARRPAKKARKKAETEEVSKARKMSPEAYSARRAEVARRANKARGIPESTQRAALHLYFQAGHTASEVATKLGISKGAVRGTVNRAYARMAPETRSAWKGHHGSVVRQGGRNGRYRGPADLRCREGYGRGRTPRRLA